MYVVATRTYKLRMEYAWNIEAASGGTGDAHGRRGRNGTACCTCTDEVVVLRPYGREAANGGTGNVHSRGDRVGAAQHEPVLRHGTACGVGHGYLFTA